MKGVQYRMTNNYNNIFLISSSTGTATTTLFNIMNNGYVGIGTSTPATMLDINGYAKVLQTSTTTACSDTIQGSIFFNSSNGGFWGCGNASIWTQLGAGTITSAGTVGSGVTGQFPYYAAGGTTLTATSNIFLSGSNIGIGTTTPNWLLQVAGVRPSIALSDTGAGTNLKHWILSSMGGNLYISTSTDAYATSSAADLAILSNGYTGIGTSTPTTMLDINGYAKVLQTATTTACSATIQGAIFYNQSNGGFWGCGNASIWTQLGAGTATNANTVGTGIAGQFPYYAAGGTSLTATSSIFLATNSNIGIGTTSPYSVLSISNNWNTPALTPLFTIASTSALGTGTTTLMTVLSSGNVGIGTSTPAYTLDVFGLINTSQNGGYLQASQLLAYASSTNQTTVFGLGAGGQNATTSATLAQNTAIGYQAMNALAGGTNNVAVGNQALYLASTATFNTAIGSGALGGGILTGANNIAIGSSTLYKATTANYNTAIGYLAMGNGVVTGSSSIAIGQGALYNLTSGTNNIAIGSSTLFNNSTASYNTALGYLSMGLGAVTGTNNVAVGSSTLYNATSAAYNTAVGAGALFNGTQGTYNNALGYLALFGAAAGFTGNNNNAIGSSTLYSATTAANNNAIGNGAMALSSTAAYNNAIGYLAMGNGIATGNGYNNAIGFQTLYKATAGTYNNAIGYQAMGNANVTTGSNNTAIGNGALFNLTTGTNNIAIGSSTLFNNSTASYDTAIGYLSMGLGAVTGTNNVAIGSSTLYKVVAGANNVAIGNGALFNITSGSNNVMIGTEGNPGGNEVTTGYNDILLGYNSQIGTSTTATNFLNIGNTFFGTLMPTFSNTVIQIPTIGNFGIATATPFAEFAISANNGMISNYNNVFLISSSTATATTTLFNILNSGYVGIGTSTANWNLQVASTRPSFALSDTSATAGLKHWLFSSMGGKLYIGTSSDAFATSTLAAITILNNGDVGIGSSTPWADLSVTNENASGPTFVAGSTAGATQFVVAGSGNVGIGTSSPSSKLEVAGDIRISSGSGGKIIFDGGTTLSNNSVTGSAGLTAMGDLTFETSAGINFRTAVNGVSSTTRMYVTNAGLVGIGVGVSPTYNFDVSGLGHFTGLVDALRFVATSSSATSTFAGAVGVGTTTPTMPFSVGGNMIIGASAAGGTPGALTISGLGVAAGTFLAVNPSGQVIATTTPTGGTGISTTLTAGWTLVGNSANTAQATSTLFIGSIGNVGIGTTSPYSFLSISNNWTTPALTPLFTIASTSALGTGTTTLMTVLSSGYVGIGTSSPAYALDVAGPINTNQYAGYYQAGYLFAYASTTNQDTILGLKAGGNNATTTATVAANIAIGFQAFSASTTGIYNNVIGVNALFNDSTGSSNNVLGYKAMGLGLVTGNGNNAIGSSTLYNATSASYNNAIGGAALLSASTGSYNNAVGFQAMGGASAVTGNGYNNALGYQALFNATSAAGNNALGYLAMGTGANVTAADNNALGRSALAAATSATGNNAIGYQALAAATTAYYNNAIGYQAMAANAITGNGWNNAIGYQALYKDSTASSYNNALGYAALGNGTVVGSNNTGIGFKALYNLTTGYDNYMIGNDANPGGNEITTGFNNLLFGYNAQLGTSTNASNFLNIGNTFFGTLMSTSTATTIQLPTIGNFGIATATPFAEFAISANNGMISNYNNIFIISSSTGTATTTLFNVLNSGYVGIGTSTPTALFSINANGLANSAPQFIVGSTTGSNFVIANNGYVGLGTTSPWGLLSLSPNGLRNGAPQFVIASSSAATSFIVTNGGYVGVGTSTPYSLFSLVNNVNTTPNTPLFTIASTTGGTSTSTLMTILASGYVGIGTSSPDVLLSIGSASYTNAVAVAHFENNVGSCYINPTGGSISCTSDERLKKNFNAITPESALESIEQLSPTFFNWNSEASSTPQHSGFLAQQILPIFPELVSLNPDGYYSLNYAGFTPYLTGAIQELNTRLIALENASSTISLSATSTIISLGSWTDSFSTALQSAVNSALQKITSTNAKAVSAVVGVFDTVFAREVHTDKLCVGDVCVTQEQFLKMVQSSGATPESPEVVTPPADNQPPADVSSSTSTPPTDAPSEPAVEDTSSTASASTDISSPPTDSTMSGSQI